MNRTLSIATAVAAALGLAACGGSGSNDTASGEIVIGASIPETGPLASFGDQLRSGYSAAVDAVNDSGGLPVGGEKRKVRLVFRDNKSDPNTATAQARTLLLEEKAVALLGAVSPPLNIPMAGVAESRRTPFVTSLTPIQAFRSGSEQGWKYAWDLYFDEKEMTDRQFDAADRVETNKRVALFTDTGEDGQVLGDLWRAKARARGYKIVSDARFPVGTTNYGTFIAKAKEAKADVVIALMVPPDAFALWKQMRAAGFSPRAAFCEKCANVRDWTVALKDVGQGTGASGVWSPVLKRPGTDQMVRLFAKKYGRTVDFANVVATYTAAGVLLDAISSAGSTDAEKVNGAIRATDADYPLTRVRFDDRNTLAVPTMMFQWQGSGMEVVAPTDVPNRPLRAPVAGLQR